MKHFISSAPYAYPRMDPAGSKRIRQALVHSLFRTRSSDSSLSRAFAFLNYDFDVVAARRKRGAQAPDEVVITSDEFYEVNEVIDPAPIHEHLPYVLHSALTFSNTL